jgi:hypothetical protein
MVGKDDVGEGEIELGARVEADGELLGAAGEADEVFAVEAHRLAVVRDADDGGDFRLVGTVHAQQVEDVPVGRDDRVAFQPGVELAFEPLRVARQAIAQGPAFRVQQVGGDGSGHHHRAEAVAPGGAVTGVLHGAPEPPTVFDDGDGGAVVFAFGEQSRRRVARRRPGASPIVRATDDQVAILLRRAHEVEGVAVDEEGAPERAFDAGQGLPSFAAVAGVENFGDGGGVIGGHRAEFVVAGDVRAVGEDGQARGADVDLARRGEVREDDAGDGREVEFLSQGGARQG